MRQSNLAHGPTETEVKIWLSDLHSIFSKLHAVGLQESVPRLFESNTLYDRPDRFLVKQGKMLRLRQVGEKAVVTWKGPKIEGPHKSRPELETTVGSREILHAILTEIGFQPSFRYEKFRTEFQSSKADGVVTVDETPIGFFLELEGDGSWIDQMARQLGFSESDYILDSYGKLYEADCKRRKIEPAHMVFAQTE